MSRPYRKQELQTLYQDSFRREGEVKLPPTKIEVAPLETGIAQHKEAAVGLVLRYDKNNEDAPLEFLLTLRARHLKHHPSQVCLPGGLVEEGESAQQTHTLDREFFEEVGIERKSIEWMEPPWEKLKSLYGLDVFPYLGFLEVQKCPPNLKLDQEEVDEAGWLPFDDLFRPELWTYQWSPRAAAQDIEREKLLAWRGWKHKTWGLTAAFLAIFVRRVTGGFPIDPKSPTTE